MLPLGALFVVLALPIVRVIYERGAFDAEASALVTSVLMVYGLGMFVYLARDVLVRVFYAMGDGQTPFRISLVNIVLNGVLDYIFIRQFGAPGLVLATVGVNIFSTLVMVMVLHKRLRGLPLLEWGGAIAALTAVSLMAGGGRIRQLPRAGILAGQRGNFGSTDTTVNSWPGGSVDICFRCHLAPHSRSRTVTEPPEAKDQPPIRFSPTDTSFSCSQTSMPK